MNIHRIFSFDNFRLAPGVLVQEHTLTSGQKIPAILMGEAGRGRKLAVCPIKKAVEVGATIVAARPQKAGDGCNLLDPSALLDGVDDSACLVVIRCEGGFRGDLHISGERISPPGVDYPEYHPVPKASVLAQGNIAQGAAGAMGASTQGLYLLRDGEIISVRPTGRRHAGTHCLRWLDGVLHVATLEERQNGLADAGVWPPLPAAP